MKKENDIYPGKIFTDKEIRKFSTGATKDTAGEKIDLEGFLSPLALHSYGEYMKKHRKQSDGNLRDSDNWQKGIPLPVYIKSIWRHQTDLWAIHRGYLVYKERTDKGEITHILLKQTEFKNPGWVRVTIEEALGGLIFNSFGYLHEYIKMKNTYIVPEKCAENIKSENATTDTVTISSKQWEEIQNFIEEFREK